MDIVQVVTHFGIGMLGYWVIGIIVALVYARSPKLRKSGWLDVGSDEWATHVYGIVLGFWPLFVFFSAFMIIAMVVSKPLNWCLALLKKIEK